MMRRIGKSVFLRIGIGQNDPEPPRVCPVCSKPVHDEERVIIKAWHKLDMLGFGTDLLPTRSFSWPAHTLEKNCGRNFVKRWFVATHGFTIFLGIFALFFIFFAYIFGANRSLVLWVFVPVVVVSALTSVILRSKLPLSIQWVDGYSMLEGYEVYEFTFRDEHLAAEFARLNNKFERPKK